MNKVYFGFDTSNYSTSFAVCKSDGGIAANYKKMLTVKHGERGLRQSDAVFQHVQNLDFISESIREFRNMFPEGSVAAVGYSYRPRDTVGSYMPCFLPGKGTALAISASLGVPSYGFSHQAGHVAAALYGADAVHLFDKEFIAFHVSGGTTDVLHVVPSREHGFEIERIGGTKDLNAGQVIDRAGVLMGLPFPSGKYLEAEAEKNKKPVPEYKISVNGLECNLSGVENKAIGLFASENDIPLVSSFVLDALLKTLNALTDNVSRSYPLLPVVYSGGVMSCRRFRDMLSGTDRFFASPEYSSDNAAGVAYLAMTRHRTERAV